MGLFKRLLTALGNGFADLADFLDTSNGNFAEFAAYLGVTPPPAYQALATQAGTLRVAVTAIANTPNPSYEQLATLADAVVTFVTAIESAAGNTAANNNANPGLTIDWTAFSERLAGTLVMAGLRRYLPAAYHWLALVGVFTGNGNFYTVGDDAYETRAFNLAHFKALLSQPTTYLTKYFGWGVDFTFDSTMQADLMSLLEVLGTEPVLVNADVYSPPAYDGVTDPTGRGVVFLPFKGTVGNVLNKLLSVSLLAQSTYDPNMVMVEETDPVTGEVTSYPSSGPYDEFVLNLLSDTPQQTPFNIGSDLTLQFVDLRDGLRFQVGPNGINFTDGSGLDLPTLSIDRAVVLTYAPAEPLIVIGEPGKTRLQVEKLELSLSLGVNMGVKLSLEAINSKLVINGSEGDSFFSKVLPNSTVTVPLSVSLSSSNGLRFNGGNSLAIQAAPNLQLGPVLFENLVLGLASTPQYDIQIMAHAGVVVTLGPVEVSATDLGVSFGIKDLSNPKDIAFGFDLPKGLGIFIDSDAVLGGGYLFLDPLNHKYAGAAQLSIKEKINLSAVGILQTQLPNNPNAYSFLLLITAEFTPIQLGLGFTLNAVGGLIGINRSVNVSYLRGLVQSGRMNTLLFPPNVLGNPETAIATVENAFPAAEGRYVFGIMAKIGWGTPNLITLDAALIIELPAPVRLVLLGVLRAILPNEQTPILRLRADFLGVVDFGAKRIAFDASLVDSRILQFTLTGDAAFRLYQGENPVFLLTSGGFHPSFQPPANADLPTLRRLTLALANGNDFRLTLSSYVAITANTVQFGSRLDLFVDLPGPFTLVGFMGFDALFQFNPFRIAVQVAAGVAIKKGSRSVLSLYLRLAVTGPGPWHVDGEGSFKILFFKIKFRVNRTFGQGAAPQPLPSTDVRTLLLQALNDPKSWEVEQPVTRPASLVVLRAEPADATRLLVNPGGKLTVRQRVVPLAYRIERFGNTRPTTGNEFNIISASIGATNPIPVPGTNLEEIRDHFSPGQFRQMSDAEKLSAPSFQTMRSGARLGIVVEGLTGGASVIRTSEYELKIARNVAQGDLAGRPASSSGAQSAAQKDATTSDTSSQIVQPTGPDPVVSTSVKVPMSSQLSERLARNGAVGRTARSYEQRRPSRMAPDKVFWDEDTYAVVSTRNLLPHVNTPFPNEASATQALGDMLRANPNLTGELQVIPSYQLPASVTASNLALA